MTDQQRQRSIAPLVRGYTYRDAAASLGVSRFTIKRTVKRHRATWPLLLEQQAEPLIAQWRIRMDLPLPDCEVPMSDEGFAELERQMAAFDAEEDDDPAPPPRPRHRGPPAT